MLERLLLAAILAVTLASAQRGRGGGGGDPSGSDDLASRRGRAAEKRATRYELLASRLKLNREQKTEVENILNAAQEQAAPLSGRLRLGRNDVAAALIGGKGGEELKNLIDSYSAVVAQMTGIETNAFSKIYATLKPKQQAKAGQAFELMAGMFQGRDWRTMR